MRLGDVGEFGLIARVEALARRVQGDRVALGIGDDAALLRPRAGEDWAVTTDAHVEDVHFRFGEQTARALGRLHAHRCRTGRTIDRLIKVARTVADLAGDDAIDRGAVLQAAGYRALDDKPGVDVRRVSSAAR